MVGEQPSFVEKIARGAGSVATLARAIAPIVSMVNTEEKFVDKSSTVSLPVATPAIISLTNMAQGLTDITRIGDSIKARFLQLRLKFTPLFSAVASNHIRMMLVIDKSINAATPVNTLTLANLFQNSADILSPINKDQGDRFVILKDKQIILNNLGAGTANPGGDTRFLKLNMPLDFHIRFVAPTTTDLGPNNVFLVLWSDVVTTGPTCSYYSRFKYTDN